MTNLDYDEKTLQEIIAQNCILNEENVELRKQVDELKALIQNMEQGYYPITQLRENMEKEKEQTVKYKAKEIISLLEDMDKRGMTVLFNMVLRQLKERCGVEVE